MRIICFGTFDILHPGHLFYFESAKKIANELIVVIARDLTKKNQNKQILFSEQDRLNMVKALSIVNQAYLGNVDDHFKIIEDLKPNFILLGYDQKIEIETLRKELSSRGLYPKIERALPFQPEKFKSSLLRKIVNKL